MNNIHQWNEVISALEMENFKHEEAILLLREANLPNPGLLTRIGMTIKNMFGGLRNHLHNQQTTSRHSNHAATRKLVI